jgi:ring-1,2-phenylacetyl-CoA epoxidase subunit PaaC
MSTVTTDGLDQETRTAIRDLILVLADTKRLLGYRYAEWMLGAPELETGIACASMAQDEWGHARLLYALLKEFGDDVDRLEHARDAADYRNLELLDETPASWPEVVVLQAFADEALSVQLAALRESSYTALRQRVGKLLDEEVFHAAHGRAWCRRRAESSEAARDALREAVRRALPPLLAWFGPDSERARALHEGGVVGALPSALRAQFIDRVAPLVALIDGDAVPSLEPDFAGFDEAARRSTRRGPDAETLANVRGDRNRAFLMD